LENYSPAIHSLAFASSLGLGDLHGSQFGHLKLFTRFSAPAARHVYRNPSTETTSSVRSGMFLL
jgi:hypothetical protein